MKLSKVLGAIGIRRTDATAVLVYILAAGCFARIVNGILVVHSLAQAFDSGILFRLGLNSYLAVYFPEVAMNVILPVWELAVLRNVYRYTNSQRKLLIGLLWAEIAVHTMRVAATFIFKTGIVAFYAVYEILIFLIVIMIPLIAIWYFSREQVVQEFIRKKQEYAR